MVILFVLSFNIPDKVTLSAQKKFSIKKNIVMRPSNQNQIKVFEPSNKITK